MYGRMGNERVTTRNVSVVRVDAAKNLLLVSGSVPGHTKRSSGCAPPSRRSSSRKRREAK